MEHHQACLQKGQGDRAEHRTVGRRHPAQHDHGHELDRDEEAERIGADEALLVREQAAGDGAEHRGEHEHPGLRAGGVDTHHLGRELRAVHGAQCPARPRVDDVEGEPDDGEHDGRHDPVPVQVGLDAPAEQAQAGDPRQPVRTAGECHRLHHDDVHDDAEAERRHRQVVALEPKDGAGDQPRDQEHDRHAGQHPEPRAQAVAGREDGGAVRAQAEEGGMTERDLARVADQQVQADCQYHVEAHRDADHGDEVVLGEKQR